jgi:hypothetical protein
MLTQHEVFRPEILSAHPKDMDVHPDQQGRRRIALITHDNKKTDIAEWVGSTGRRWLSMISVPLVQPASC